MSSCNKFSQKAEYGTIGFSCLTEDKKHLSVVGKFLYDAYSSVFDECYICPCCGAPIYIKENISDTYEFGDSAELYFSQYVKCSNVACNYQYDGILKNDFLGILNEPDIINLNSNSTKLNLPVNDKYFLKELLYDLKKAGYTKIKIGNKRDFRKNKNFHLASPAKIIDLIHTLSFENNMIIAYYDNKEPLYKKTDKIASKKIWPDIPLLIKILSEKYKMTTCLNKKINPKDKLRQFYLYPLINNISIDYYDINAKLFDADINLVKSLSSRLYTQVVQEYYAKNIEKTIDGKISPYKYHIWFPERITYSNNECTLLYFFYLIAGTTFIL